MLGHQLGEELNRRRLAGARRAVEHHAPLVEQAARLEAVADAKELLHLREEFVALGVGKMDQAVGIVAHFADAQAQIAENHEAIKAGRQRLRRLANGVEDVSGPGDAPHFMNRFRRGLCRLRRGIRVARRRYLAVAIIDARNVGAELVNAVHGCPLHQNVEFHVRLKVARGWRRNHTEIQVW